MDWGAIVSTFLSAMTPIGELRLAIPLGMTDGLLWYEAYGWAVLGNMVPVLLLLWGLDPVARFLTSFRNPAGRLLEWRVTRIRERQAGRFERWGPLALVPFVAVPLPVTGAWTGCLAAWALGIPPKRALAPIFLGVLIAGAIVTAVVEASVNFPFIHD